MPRYEVRDKICIVYSESLKNLLFIARFMFNFRWGYTFIVQASGANHKVEEWIYIW